jgi:Protein of unknown function (DUF3046)
VRHTELWVRLEAALGAVIFKTWAESQAITDLGSRTVNEALADGVPPKQIWAAVWAVLELPEKDK